MVKTQNLGEAPIGSLLIKYSIPAIIGMAVNALYNVVDRVFIGNIPGVGELAITGLGITMPIITILLAFGMLVGVGTTANISIRLGQGNKEEAEKILGNAVTLGLIIGILITIIGIIFVNPLLEMFGASKETLPFAKEYINVILIGSIFNILGFSLTSTIRADGKPHISSIIMVTGCITNIILDSIFIFGLKWGIKGAAFATITSQFVTTCMVMNYYIKSKSNLKLRKENLKLNKNIIKIIFSIGLAPFTMQIAASIVQIIANNSLKIYGGDLAIGAMAAISSISMMFMMPIFGINQGAQPLIGFNYGAKKIPRVKKFTVCSIIAATSILTIGWIIIQLFPSEAIYIFNNNQNLLEIGKRGIRIYCLMMPIISINIVGTTYFQSTGNAKIAAFLSLSRQVIFLIPLMLILPKFIGLDGVWASVAGADFLSTVVTFTFLVREFKKLNKIEIDNKQTEKKCNLEEVNIVQ